MKKIILIVYAVFFNFIVYSATTVDICTQNSITICSGERLKITCSSSINGASCTNGSFIWEWYEGSSSTLKHTSSGELSFLPTDNINYTLKIISNTSSGKTTHLTKNLSVTVKKGIQIKKIEFLSDHNLMLDGSDVNTPGTRVPDIEWDSDVGVNAPMTHSKSSTNKIQIKLYLENIDATNGDNFTIIGTSSETALNFTKTGTVPSTSTFEITIDAQNPIGDEIRKISKEINWSISTGSLACVAKYKSGPHMIYTTFDVPNTTAPCNGSKINVSRMEEAISEMTDAISRAKTGGYDCQTGYVYELNNVRNYFLGRHLDNCNTWTISHYVDGADCISIANYIRNICYTFGVSGTFTADFFSAYYKTVTTPSRPLIANQSISLNSPAIFPGSNGLSFHAGLNPTWQLALADQNCLTSPPTSSGVIGCTGGLNAFEAAVIYTDQAGRVYYFPGGVTGIAFDNKDDVVKRIFQSLVWVGRNSSGNLEVKFVDHPYTQTPTTPTPTFICP